MNGAPGPTTWHWGERRAQSVRDMILELGALAEQVDWVSYGGGTPRGDRPGRGHLETEPQGRNHPGRVTDSVRWAENDVCSRWRAVLFTASALRAGT